MTYYCTLFLRSDKRDVLSAILPPAAIEALDQEDNQSPVNLARAQRMRIAGFVTRSDLPRYAWYVDSREGVSADESDPLVHVSWLFSQLKPGVLLADAKNQGLDSSLAFYWGGQGTGGGPFISSALAELLAHHKVGLDVGFYYEESASAI
ncbi:MULTISPECIES: hypothetical protein [Polaromonas]|uniref:DUF4279 domain-containing protein n=1 Tax=Polaromonas aquatica TaxID=332657 RepID=A0ABW1TSC1_9BURK